ncbi:MAG: alpha/beta fold hydrolase [Pseudomonadota bacterium]
MFKYFPANYTWSLAVMRAMASGALLGDIHWACKGLLAASTAVPGGDNEAWHQAWLKLSRQVEGIADAAAGAGNSVTAINHYLRAALYYQWAEAFLPPADARCGPTFASHLATFAKGAALHRAGIEIVDIPFEGQTLYAYFVPAVAPASARPPTVLLSDGLDGTKEEMVYAALAVAERGMNCLAIDHPGQGATLRLSGLKARHDSEVAAGAAIDYLLTRGDVDPQRIGIFAASMGGYYAPRAAAYEKRLKACVAWGAVYDYRGVWARRFKAVDGQPLAIDTLAALGTTGDHILHILGVDSFDAVLEYLKPFTMQEAAKHITCDILLVHGEDDKQTPVEDMETLFAAISTPKKEKRIFTHAEGGAAHVQLDRPEPALSMICDWLAQKL